MLNMFTYGRLHKFLLTSVIWGFKIYAYILLLNAPFPSTNESPDAFKCIKSDTNSWGSFNGNDRDFCQALR